MTGDIPLQPIYRDGNGVVRFEANSLVRFLLDWATPRGMGLNELALGPFPVEHREQFAQLIGYSVSGFGDLSYARPETVARADATAASLVAHGVEPAAGYEAGVVAGGPLSSTEGAITDTWTPQTAAAAAAMIEAAVAAERERCARVADAVAAEGPVVAPPNTALDRRRRVAAEIAAAIRAGAEPAEGD